MKKKIKDLTNEEFSIICSNIRKEGGFNIKETPFLICLNKIIKCCPLSNGKFCPTIYYENYSCQSHYEQSRATQLFNKLMQEIGDNKVEL